MSVAGTTIIIIIMLVLVLYILQFSGLADLIKKTAGCLTNPSGSFLCVVLDGALTIVGAKQLSEIVKNVKGTGKGKGKGGEEGGGEEPDVDPEIPEFPKIPEI